MLGASRHHLLSRTGGSVYHLLHDSPPPGFVPIAFLVLKVGQALPPGSLDFDGLYR